MRVAGGAIAVDVSSGERFGWWHDQRHCEMEPREAENFDATGYHGFLDMRSRESRHKEFAAAGNCGGRRSGEHGGFLARHCETQGLGSARSAAQFGSATLHLCAAYLAGARGID